MAFCKPGLHLPQRTVAQAWLAFAKVRLLVNTVCVYSFSRERDDANTKKALGDRLRAARRRCALSQDEVAELLGVKRQTVSAWETGVTVPTAFQVADLAAAYCASAHHLLFGAHYERVDVKALLPSAGSPGELAIPSVPLHVDEQSALLRPGVAAPLSLVLAELRLSVSQ